MTDSAPTYRDLCRDRNRLVQSMFASPAEAQAWVAAHVKGLETRCREIRRRDPSLLEHRVVATAMLEELKASRA